MLKSILKVILPLLALLVSINQLASAQNSFLEAIKSSKKLCGYSIDETSSGDIVVAGGSHISSENKDALILRFNRDGKLQAQKSFGGSSLEQFRAVKATDDGGYIAAGFARSFGGAGLSEISLIKFTATGSIQWKRLIGSSSDDVAFAIDETSDRNIVLVGSTTNTGNGDILTVKINPSNGNIIWQKSFGLPNSVEEGHAVAVARNGSILIAGKTTYSDGNYDVIILKTDSTGKLLWSRILKNAWNEWRSFRGELPVSLSTTSDGGVLLGFNSNVGLTSIVLVKFNSGGNRIWAKKYGPQNTFWSVKAVSDGFVVTGEWGIISPRFLVYKTDLTGNIRWYRTIESGDYSLATASAISADSTYLVTGCLGSGSLLQQEAVLPLLKLDKLGSLSNSCATLEDPKFPFTSRTMPTPFSTISLTTSDLSLRFTNSTLGEKSFSASGTTVCKSNGGGAVCGNGKCEAGETKESCPQDCKGAEPQCHPCYTGRGVCIDPDARRLNCDDIPWENFSACSSDPYGLDGDNDGVACESGPDPDPDPDPEPECHPCYSVCLDPNHDVDCGEIPYTNFRACSSDPWRLDGDNDGIACEN